MNTYIVDYNAGNLLILKTEAIQQDFEALVDECIKDGSSPYERLLDLLRFHKFKYRVVIDTYDMHIYEI